MSALTEFMNTGVVSRLRRNHGLEHATLHILAEKYPHVPMAGHTDLNGFVILGDVRTEDVRLAVAQAMERMHAGESDLAVHPNCGTNFVASGIVAGMLAWIAMLGGGRRLRSRLERLPVVISLVTLGLIFSQPLGFILQARVTTSGVPGEMRVEGVFPEARGRMTAHRVRTRG